MANVEVNAQFPEADIPFMGEYPYFELKSVIHIGEPYKQALDR